MGTVGRISHVGRRVVITEGHLRGNRRPLLLLPHIRIAGPYLVVWRVLETLSVTCPKNIQVLTSQEMIIVEALWWYKTNGQLVA